MESQVKKLKLNYYDIPYFHTQYKSILLLLHFGIWDLPFELVLTILKDYVYIPPIRISQWCMESYPCQHTIEGRKVAMDAFEIMNWFAIHKIPDMPNHFQPISMIIRGYPDSIDEL